MKSFYFPVIVNRHFGKHKCAPLSPRRLTWAPVKFVGLFIILSNKKIKESDKAGQKIKTSLK